MVAADSTNRNTELLVVPVVVKLRFRLSPEATDRFIVLTVTETVKAIKLSRIKTKGETGLVILS